MWRSGYVITWPSTRSSGVSSPGWCWGWARRASPPSSPTPGPGTSSATGSSREHAHFRKSPVARFSRSIVFLYLVPYCIETWDILVNVFRVGSGWIWIFLQHSVWIRIRKIVSFIHKMARSARLLCLLIENHWKYCTTFTFLKVCTFFNGNFFIGRPPQPKPDIKIAKIGSVFGTWLGW